MKGAIRLVLFDLGSTLIYENASWDGLFPRADEALWRVLRQKGVSLQTQDIYGNQRTLFDLYSDVYGEGLSEPTMIAVLGDLLRGKGFSLSEEQLREAMRAMFSVTQANWSAEDDAVPTLRALRDSGFHTGVISNASDEDNAQALVDNGGLRPYLDYIVTSAAFGTRKPDPSIFQLALNFFHLGAREAVMVGDTPEADIAGAHRSGMQGIWIKRRAHGPVPISPEAVPDATISALSEIPALLNPGAPG